MRLQLTYLPAITLVAVTMTAVVGAKSPTTQRSALDVVKNSYIVILNDDADVGRVPGMVSSGSRRAPRFQPPPAAITDPRSRQRKHHSVTARSEASGISRRIG